MPAACCRARRGGSASPRTESPFCSALENGGASFQVWPVSTRAGIKLVSTVTLAGKQLRLDVLSYLQTYRCEGPTGNWLRGELTVITSALRLHPELFTPYSTNGLPLSVVCKISRSAKG